MCNGPVGLGANRTLTGFDIVNLFCFFLICHTELVEVFCKDKRKLEVKSQNTEVFFIINNIIQLLTF